VNCLTGVLSKQRSRMPNYGIFEYTRQRAEALQRQNQPAPVVYALGQPEWQLSKSRPSESHNRNQFPGGSNSPSSLRPGRAMAQGGELPTRNIESGSGVSSRLGASSVIPNRLLARLNPPAS
jgi:hypothetical protein